MKEVSVVGSKFDVHWSGMDEDQRVTCAEQAAAVKSRERSILSKQLSDWLLSTEEAVAGNST